MSEESPSSSVTVSVIIQDPAWRELLAQPDVVAKRASRAALDDGAVQSPAVRLPHGAELCVVLGNDALVHKLNREFRHTDGPTNVLSFADLDGPAETAPGSPRLLGDVVLALETVRAEAREQGKSGADHLTHLVVHGVLHLLGYDHQSDRDAEAMETLERSILTRLGIADPYNGGGSVPQRSVTL